ncbi:MAG: fibronectin type III domain-containing protein [Candidatus Yonathbacteria bacterium]|nr:fibronectin type III domain-containing protein [Candidatus Yonathbacteria bacterium]
MKIDIEKKLEQLGVKSITENEKNMLWSKIQSGFYAERARGAIASSVRHRSFLPKILNFRVAMASLLIGSFLTGSTIVAADSAKPGDLLFPVDIAVENVRIVLAANGKKDELKIKFAGERLGEAKIILTILMNRDGVTYTTATSSATSTSATQGTNGTASSTATTTPWGDSMKEKVRGNLAVVLLHLEQTKLDLENRGNQAGVLALENIIRELGLLAETHIDDFEEMKAEIKSDGKKLRIEIKTEERDLKSRLKFRSDWSNSTTTSREIRIEDGEARMERNGTSTMKVREERNNEEKRDNRNKNDENEDDDEDSKHEEKKVEICHTSFFRIHRTLEISRAAVNAHLAHGDTIGKCDKDDDNDDITTPVISNIIANATTTTARVTWSTNEASNSKVWYATATPLVLGGNTLSESSSGKVTAHSLTLSGLTASTTYYFVVASTDAAGNMATSSTLSFITLSGEILDTTAPIISSIATTAATTTATVSWNTNETSNGSVWYATTTPLSLSSTPIATNSSFTLAHSFTLSGLTASTTYYFVVKSADIASNAATSTEHSFTTLGE